MSQEITTLTLPLASLLPEEAVAELQDALGDQFRQLEREERIVLVTNWLEEKITHERLMQILDIHSRDLTLMLENLVKRDLLVRRGTGRGCYYELGIGNSQQPEFWERDRAPQVGASNSSNNQGSSSNKLDSSSNKTSSPSNSDSSDSDSDEAGEDEKGWSNLQRLAQPIRETGRVSDRSEMEDVILRLCSEQPLNIHQLANLLDRNPDGLRNNYLSQLVKEGRLELKHPERLSHPEQAYITAKKE